MSAFAFELTKVRKTYPHFELQRIDLNLPTGCIMGFIGPNGAGKSTTIRILMGLVHHDSGNVTVLQRPMPARQHDVKLDVGFVSEDMRLYSGATVRWHMDFIASIYPTWDASHAEKLLKRFDLNPDHKVKGLSRGQAVKTSLLLVLARHPKLLILDEPTTGLDPVVRQEVLSELMEVVRNEDHTILMSSHNTQDVEQISDTIALIYKGEILESDDKESFLDRWRRVRFEAAPERAISLPGNCHLLTRDGRLGALITGNYSDKLVSDLQQAGASILDTQRMTLEEIFLSRIDIARKETV
ncbi:MAG: ABC transporter ATP-binding protein [Candidatus Zixiibacteriota bacterium]